MQKRAALLSLFYFYSAFILQDLACCSVAATLNIIADPKASKLHANEQRPNKQQSIYCFKWRMDPLSSNIIAFYNPASLVFKRCVFRSIFHLITKLVLDGWLECCFILEVILYFSKFIGSKLGGHSQCIFLPKWYHMSIWNDHKLSSDDWYWKKEKVRTPSMVSVTVACSHSFVLISFHQIIHPSFSPEYSAAINKQLCLTFCTALLI